MLYLYLISMIIFLFSLEASTIVMDFDRKRRLGKLSTNNLYFIVVFMLLCFFTIFRGKSIGNDTEIYMFYFEYFSEVGVTKGINFELGYQLFNIFISKISSDPRTIIIASSFFSYLLVGTYFYKKCYKPFWAIALFFPLFFSLYTNAIRMTCSISLLLWAYNSVKNKKLFSSVLWIAISVLFHVTSLAFVPLAIIVYKEIKFTPKLYMILLSAIFVLSIASNFVLFIMLRISSIFDGRFDNYLSGMRTETGTLGIIFSMFILFVIYFCYIKIVQKDKRGEAVKWLFAFSFIFYIFSFSMNLFDRIASLFLLVLIVPVVNEMVISKTKNKKRYFVIMISTLIFCFLFKCYIRPEWNNLYPYSFMWD